VEMCHQLQAMSSTSTKYPCAAAGYCSAEEEHFASADVQCEVGRFFSCQPKKFCRRVRHNFLQFSCVLKPGFGRWVGLRNSLTDHAGALASGILERRHCGEPNAGPYCIAKPTGWGAICEIVGAILSIIYGGYQSILAIESPGGDDDTQWLTFWLVQGAVLSVERFWLRPILSTVTMYYELKLCLLIWLMWFNGAERAYRRFRRLLMGRTNIIQSAHQKAQHDMEILQDTGKALVQKRLREIQKEITLEREDSLRKSRSWRSRSQNIPCQALPELQDWEPDFEDDDESIDNAHDENVRHEFVQTPPRNNNTNNSEKVPKLLDEPAASSKMERLSKYLLSPEGGREILNSDFLSRHDKQHLIAWAHQQLQFEPKYLYINLIGTVKGPAGILPRMDANGLADPYVTCRLIRHETPKEGSQRVLFSPEDSPSRTERRSTPQSERSPSSRTQNRTTRTRRAKRPPLLRRVRNVLKKFRQGQWGQSRIVKSRIIYNTRRPQWKQMLELPLAGCIDSTGIYHNNSIQDTSLCLEVWDADIEFWGFVLRFSPVIITIMSLGSLFAYVAALSDHLSSQETTIIRGVYLVILLLLGMAYVMAEINQADDDPIGYCTVPLHILMDKAEHKLRLTLRELPRSQFTFTSSITRHFQATDLNGSQGLSTVDENDGKESCDADDSSSTSDDKTPTNDVGGYGVVRCELMLSET